MLVRNCAGGLVFRDDKVLLLLNEKNEWVFPKGVIRSSQTPEMVAVVRVRQEAGVAGRIISSTGHTNYEFYSISRQRPVCNKISWFIMETDDEAVTPDPVEKFSEGGFFKIEDAMDKITYSQDRSLLAVAYQKYRALL